MDCLDISDNNTDDDGDDAYDHIYSHIDNGVVKEEKAHKLSKEALQSCYKINLERNQQHASHCVKNIVSWVTAVGNRVGKGTLAFIDTLPSIKEDYHVVAIGLDHISN